MAPEEHAFEAALAAIPSGYSEGEYEGRRYGVTLLRSYDRRRVSLLARELGGRDLVSFNWYRLSSGERALRPCEMSQEKAIAFVLRYSRSGD
jgi:hypothetical protein